MINILKQNDQYAYAAAFIASVVFSVLAILCEPYLNNDGIFYIDAAKAIIEDGFVSSFEAYRWPFYSYLIVLAYKATGIGLHWSAFLLNSLMLGFLCVMFIRLYHEVTQGKGSLWIACILILTLNIINKYRDDVMRDFGYWCFSIIGIYCLIRFFKASRWTSLSGWQISMAAALLFRIEAIVFLVLGPLVLLLKSPKRIALKEFILLQTLPIIGVISICFSYFYVDFMRANLTTTKFRDIFKYIDINSLISGFHQAVTNIGSIFFYDGLNLDKHYPTLVIVLLTAMMAYCAIKIVMSLSIPYSAILIYGTIRKWAPISIENKLLLYFACIQSFILFSFLIKRFLIVPRYATVLAIILLLITGQIIEQGYKKIKREKTRKMVVAIISVLVLIQTGDTLITFNGYTKRHIVRAGVWAKENIEKSAPLISTDLKAIHYADRRYVAGSEISRKVMISGIKSKQFLPGTHLIINGKEEELDNVTQKLAHYLKSGDIKIEKEFRNNEGDWVFILKIS